MRASAAQPASAETARPGGLEDLRTPALVLDEKRMERNIRRMHRHLASLGVPLRPHVKTGKCIEVARRLIDGQPGGLTVSTLREAEEFFDAGFTDILYAVGIAEAKLENVLALRRRGADVSVVLDSAEQARAVTRTGSQAGGPIPVLLELDSDGHRSGLDPAGEALIEIGRIVDEGEGGRLSGVMTHAGESYNCDTTGGIAALADQEAAAVVGAAERLRAAGLPCPIVSVGSTPTATFAGDLTGVTEVRAGVFVFQDLVMAGLGVCDVQDIALSVLATVIGHQRSRGWVITDAGWMAMSRDRGTAKQAIDQGYGVVCDMDGEPVGDLIVRDANQEHGIIASRSGAAWDADRLPIGTRVRVLPNHACATGAMHGAYHVVRGDRDVHAVWPRFGGW